MEPVEDHITVLEMKAIAEKAHALVSICIVCFRPHIYRQSPGLKMPPRSCGRVACDLALEEKR